MTVEDIFTSLVAHMKEGIMMHEDMMNAFDFLGLKGYSKCQEHHYEEELNNYKILYHYYISHFNRLIKLNPINYSSIIPNNWYKYSAADADVSTKRDAIKDFMEKWVLWEQTTKKLFQDSYKQLEELGEIAAAIYISRFIKDVDEELEQAEHKLFELRTINYSINDIILEQKE